jgi:hypothetical protein
LKIRARICALKRLAQETVGVLEIAYAFLRELRELIDDCKPGDRH